MKERILFEREGNLIGVALINRGRITVNVRETDIKELYEMASYFEEIKLCMHAPHTISDKEITEQFNKALDRFLEFNELPEAIVEILKRLPEEQYDSFFGWLVFHIRDNLGWDGAGKKYNRFDYTGE
jgi:hypothetical protein